MALEFDLNDNILSVRETVHGWLGSKVSHWYYDIKNWRSSSFGKEGDVPDRDMTPEAIAWVKEYYLPKAIPQADVPAHAPEP